MLDYQVKYWQNQETKRANLANEALTAEKNRISAQANAIAQQQANTARLQAETAARQADIAYMNAQTNAYSAYQSAVSGKVNALSNWTNAVTNKKAQRSNEKLQASQTALNVANEDSVRTNIGNMIAQRVKLHAETKQIQKNTSWIDYLNSVKLSTDLFGTAAKVTDAIIPF